MPKFLKQKWHENHLAWSSFFIILLLVILFYYNWALGLIGFVASGFLIYFAIRQESTLRKDLYEYIATLTHRVKRAGSDVLYELPIGIVLYDEDKKIVWHNPYITRMLGGETYIDVPLKEVFPTLSLKSEGNDKGETAEVQVGERIYQVLIRGGERLLYFTDITEFKKLSVEYEERRPVFGILALDNLDEVTQGMDDQTRELISAKVAGVITEWGRENQFFLHRLTSERFVLIMNEKILKTLEQNRFDVLDSVREVTEAQKIPLTISIGISAGTDMIQELGRQAQSALDIALSRGGDQVAVKRGQKILFYGGRTNAVEKSTRVKARVISHSLRVHIKDSDKVLIMGHRNPDMDSIGASVGVMKAAQLCGKEGYIVLEGVNPSIQRPMEVIRSEKKLNRWFITPDQALQIATPRSLIVVVDTHKPSMVSEPKLLQQSHRVAVIDHHRRGEEFISDPLLTFVEPYASSTCELVTELLQYIHDSVDLDVIEATALLAGIIVDTKSFMMHTGARTHEAASFLRRFGADTALIQRMLQEDLDDFLQKAEIIRNTVLIHDRIALAVGEPGKTYSQLTIAKVADILLTMSNVAASFVIGERPDGKIGISARSLGQINVQVIMERLGGGGHMTNAAAQLEGSINQATEKLKKVLKQVEEEEGLFA